MRCGGIGIGSVTAAEGLCAALVGRSPSTHGGDRPRSERDQAGSDTVVKLPSPLSRHRIRLAS